MNTQYSLPEPKAREEPAGNEQTGQEQEPEAIVDLPALQVEYPDIKGWITIPGTCVDYPVLQSGAQDPEYYLRRTYKGEWRTAGSIFFQWDCTPESRNTVVYGHNMNDGTMFAVLQEDTEKWGLQELLHGKCSKLWLETDISKLSFNRTVFADDGDFLSFQEELLAQPLYHDPCIYSLAQTTAC